MNRKQKRSVDKRGLSQLNEKMVLAVTLHQAGRLPEAEAAYNAILALDPDNYMAHNNLGLMALDLGQFQIAEARLQKAVTVNPKSPDAYNNLGNLYRALRQYDQAVAILEQAVRLSPNAAPAYVNLGLTYEAVGKFDQAVLSYQQALKLVPAMSEAWSNLGNTLHHLGRIDEAVAAYEQALVHRPDYPEALNNLGNAYRTLGKLDQATVCFEKALGVRPDYLDAYLNLGNTHTDLGRHDDAVRCYGRILELRPDHVDAISNMLFSLNYSDHIAPETLAARHFELGKRLESLVPAVAAHANARAPGRRLRVGYISADFRKHAVTYFFEPLMRAHDRNAVEIFLYSQAATHDEMSQRLQAMADHWLPTLGMGDDTLAAKIQADGIDILVDLSGHSAHNRLPMFARKPAPIQATWLGYANTTGLKTVDYRIVDAVSDPEGVADALAAETLVRLPGGFLCYQPPPEAPAPAPPPCLENGFVTFGSFNNFAKLSASTLDAWGRLLARVPKSCLLIKSRFFADDGPRALFLRRLAERGVAPERVILLEGILDTAGHLGSYHRVDIGLDPFPYNGTTTTCEALWMGVPVVTLAGDRHLARVGASLLHRVGLDELVAADADAYVEIAAALAADPARMTALRAGQRARMAASTLCDPAVFTRSLEAAYREMWCRWCGTDVADLPPPAPVAATEPLRLHIGEGEINRPGWRQLGASVGPGGWPAALSRLPDGSVAEIYACHVLEHLGFQVDLPAVLREVHRVLKADGIFRVSVPNMDVLCRLFLDAPAAAEQKLFMMAHLFGGQHNADDFHKVGLNYEILVHFLSQAGFRQVRRVEEFGLFQDCSSLRRSDALISLNMEVYK